MLYSRRLLRRGTGLGEEGGGKGRKGNEAVIRVHLGACVNISEQTLFYVIETH